MELASVRMPHPLNISGDISSRASEGALSLSAIPVHRQWPIFEVRESIGLFWASRPTAYQPLSGSQNRSLKSRLSCLAFLRQRAASDSSPRCLASCARARYAAYTYPCTSASAIGASAIAPSAKLIPSQESFQPWLARPWLVLRQYSTNPSPSASPYVSIQSSARSACGSRAAIALSLPPQRCSSPRSMTNRADASAVP